MPVCPHFLMELHVALVCGVPNAPWLEHIPQLDDITAAAMRTEGGRAYPSGEPGLGIDWSRSAIDARAVDGLSATLV